MKENNSHINKNFSQPNTSIDDGWEQMSALLDKEMPVSNKKKRGFFTSVSQIIMSAAAAMVILGGGTVIGYQIIEQRKEIKNQKKNNTERTAAIVKNKLNDTVAMTLAEKVSEDSLNNLLPPDSVDKKRNPQNSTALKNESEKITGEKQNNTTNSKTIASGTTFKKNISKNSRENQDNTRKVKEIQNGNDEKTQNEDLKDIQKRQQQNPPLDSTLVEREKKALEKIKNPNEILTDETNSAQSKEKDSLLGKTDKKSPSFFERNRFFVSLSANSGLLFSNNVTGNVFSYGGLMTFGLENIDYNFGLETGVGYQALEYRVPYERKMYIYQGNDISDSVSTVSKYKYSRRSIVIPLYIKKEITKFNSLSLDVKGGLNTSVLLSQKRLFSPVPADIQEIEKNYAPAKVNFSLLLSPQIRWNFNNNTSFFISPSGVLYLNSLYQNYSLKPYGFDVSAGIYYRF